MANYIEVKTGRYPVSETQIKAENRQVSFPRIFKAPEGFEIVFPAPAPAHDPKTQAVREIAPVMTGKGHYAQAFEVVALSAEAVAANKARENEQAKAAAKAELVAALPDIVEALLNDDKPALAKHRQEHAERKAR